MDLAAFHHEITNFFPRDAERLERAAKTNHYYDLKNLDSIPRRAGESSGDYEKRPKRAIGLVFTAVEALTQHLYNPGPNRVWPERIADSWLQSVYSSNQVNLLMQSADAQATLNGACAVGIHATGNLDQPIRLDLYGADEICGWANPDDPTKSVAVCTIEKDSVSKVETYRLWTKELYRVYQTKPNILRPIIVSEEVNPYGTIPFTFIHNKKVLKGFWDGGLGDFLRRTNESIDSELSDIAQNSQFSIPIGILQNVEVGQRLIVSPGFFNQLTAQDYGMPPTASYLQASYDAVGRMSAIQEYVYLALESIGIPRSAVRTDASAMSGIAILAEALPLLNRSKRRQLLFNEYESRLAQTILQCSGQYYRIPALIDSLKLGPLSLYWPEPPLPLPFPERNEDEDWLLSNGLVSQVQLVQRRFGYTREQALAHLEQVRQDQEFLQAQTTPPPVPEPTPDPEPLPPEPDQDDEEEDVIVI